MKNFTIILFIFFPFFMLAQKGVIVPDVKTPATTIKNNLPNDIKTWIIEESLVNCIDSFTKCYIIKEDGITKSVEEDDVFDFIYEDGYRYTILVKEELKTPPININDGNYTYTLQKIISKKLIDKNAVISNSSYSNIPIVDKNDNTLQTITNTNDNNIETPITNYEAASKEEIFSLKKQVRDLKKQVDVMQLQIDMLMQVIIKK